MIDTIMHAPWLASACRLARVTTLVRMVLGIVGCLSAVTSPQVEAKPIAARSVILRASEEVRLAVAERGLLAAVPIREGQMVQQGDLMVQVDDAEARLVEARARVEQSIAHKEASQDVAIRFAQKSLDVAKAELQRALDSVKEYPNSVSATELDKLRLVVDRTSLEIEQAEHVREVARMTVELKKAEAELAAAGVRRRAVHAPIPGTVVEVRRRAGEWVEPGEMVARVVRLDRLRAEGFLEAGTWSGDLTEAAATVQIVGTDEAAATWKGRVVFVSPEVDPVNRQVRVWVELENPQFQLRPGMRAEMTIETPQ